MPRMNEAVSYLWQMYVDVKSGCESIGYIEMDAYQRVTRRVMDGWEIDAMIRIEQARKAGGY